MMFLSIDVFCKGKCFACFERLIGVLEWWSTGVLDVQLLRVRLIIDFSTLR